MFKIKLECKDALDIITECFKTITKFTNGGDSVETRVSNHKLCQEFEALISMVEAKDQWSLFIIKEDESWILDSRMTSQIWSFKGLLRSMIFPNKI